jgi:hypothetical protein
MAFKLYESKLYEPGSAAARQAMRTLNTCFDQEDWIGFESQVMYMKRLATSSSLSIAIIKDFTDAFNSGVKANLEEQFKKYNFIEADKKDSEWTSNPGVMPALPKGTIVKFEVYCGDAGTGPVDQLSWSLNIPPGPYDIRTYRVVK